MKRIAIIGGGIAGLSAAFYLEKARRAGADLQWALFEKSDRLGGVIQTERRDGFVIEAGPDSFLSIKPDAARLCQELGLGDQLISSNDASRKTYILVKSQLGSDSAWAGIHGAHARLAHGDHAAVFFLNKIAHGGGIVFCGAKRFGR